MRATSKAACAAMVWWVSCGEGFAQAEAGPTLTEAKETTPTQAAPPPVGQPEVDKTQFERSIASYRLSFADEPAAEIARADKPLLLWSNPVRKTAAGAVYLFTAKGRPQAVVCIYPTPNGSDHEWHSLAEEPIVAERDGLILWQPAVGLERLPITTGRPPAASPAVRLREMRSMARRFAARIVPPDKTPIPLRLLDSPLYRDPPSEDGGEVIDGAIFAFVQGTDPEVLLRIEAREASAAGGPDRRPVEDAAEWSYGLARMSMVPMEVSLDEQLVWRTDWARRNPTQPYHTIPVPRQ